MNSPKSSPLSDARERVRGGGLVSPGRRRFAKGAAPVLLGTLASKPVLGAQYVCTVSGHASGNVSAPLAGDDACNVGNDVAYWLANDWPAAYVKGPMPNNGCNFESNETNGTLFAAAAAGLTQTFYLAQGGGNCTVVTTTNNKPASMRQVLATASTDEVLRLGRAVVASLLNVADPGITYPVTAARIVAMFEAVKSGGIYHVEGANLNLSRLGVIEYLEMLYS